jgi:hypothetical protein
MVQLGTGVRVRGGGMCDQWRRSGAVRAVAGGSEGAATASSGGLASAVPHN